MATFWNAIFGSTALDCFFQAERRARSTLAATRPWLEMLRLRAFALPANLADTLLRVRINVGYFAVNYAVVFLLTVLFHLVWWKPSYLALFLCMAVSWILLYLYRDEDGDGDGWIPVFALSVSTLIGLLFAGAVVEFVVASAISAAAVLAHAAMRRADEVVPGAEEGDGSREWYVEFGEDGVS
ncbi:PRA1 family protein F1-like [Typha angustifolia]|uniref:PRA1 family protein F1-like n=1 Tax=Typha angustifolia TaxID=59011 RepID=UPI003C308639